jgi:hypothetical protein
MRILLIDLNTIIMQKIKLSKYNIQVTELIINQLSTTLNNFMDNNS